MTHWIVVGKIVGLYGVKGWVKLHSYTEPRSNIVNFQTLYIGSENNFRPIELSAGKAHGKKVLAKFTSVDDRDAAAALLESELAVRRDQLPTLADDEYYWSDLQGLSVINQDDIELGAVDHLFATGANDVLVVKGEREHLLPFLQGSVIQQIDLDGGTIRVDWDPDY